MVIEQQVEPGRRKLVGFCIGGDNGREAVVGDFLLHDGHREAREGIVLLRVGCPRGERALEQAIGVRFVERL